MLKEAVDSNMRTAMDMPFFEGDFIPNIVN